MNFIKYKKNNRGVILLLTLFILSGILVVTLVAADLVLSGIRMNRLAGYSSLAFYASEAGMERSLWEERKSSSFILPNNDQAGLFTETLGNGSSYIVNYASSTPNITFSSVGSYSGVKRSVQSTYEAYDGGGASCSCVDKECGSDGCVSDGCGSCISPKICVNWLCENPPPACFLFPFNFPWTFPVCFN